MSLYPGWRDVDPQHLRTGLDDGPPLPRQGRPHKFGAEAQTIDGQRFDSKLEARYWQELQLQARAGTIRDLQRQVRIDLHAAGGQLVGCYVADFTYLDVAAKTLVVADAKGVRTQLYAWKARHVAAEYGIVIREIRAEPRDRAHRRSRPPRRLRRG